MIWINSSGYLQTSNDTNTKKVDSDEDSDDEDPEVQLVMCLADRIMGFLLGSN